MVSQETIHIFIKCIQIQTNGLHIDKYFTGTIKLRQEILLVQCHQKMQFKYIRTLLTSLRDKLIGVYKKSADTNLYSTKVTILRCLQMLISFHRVILRIKLLKFFVQIENILNQSNKALIMTSFQLMTQKKCIVVLNEE